MLYVHEQNLLTKVSNNYKNQGTAIQDFLDYKYYPMRESVLALDFSENNLTDFEAATRIFNNYYDELLDFSRAHGIASQSKFESTFLEEISCYLFKDIPEIVGEELNVFNKGIYAGLKIDNNKHIEVIKKDVDFCIGKKVNVAIDNQPIVSIILPIVAVEVKTYLDATMFGEVKSSSKSIRSASPNSKTYVLMGYKCLADEHIIAARQDSTLTEIFVLRANANSPMDFETIYEYWKEIHNAIEEITAINQIIVPGRILKL